MSRHRLVRNIDLAEELADDDWDSGDEEYSEDSADGDESPAEHGTQHELVDKVKAVVRSNFTEIQIYRALERNKNDVNSTINYLLESRKWKGTDEPRAIPSTKPVQKITQTLSQIRVSAPTRSGSSCSSNSGTSKPKPKPPTPKPSPTSKVLVSASAPTLAGRKASPSPRTAFRKLDVRAEYLKKRHAKPLLNLIVGGHVDAGKSTLMGHLLYILGNVEDKTLRRYERDATNAGKGSFMYAWVLDQTETERSRGVTVDISMIHFETENRHFTLLDAPGHRDFVPNMIMGASQADVGMLVVDATPGEFESGFEADGQTKEHALLMRSLGVQQMLVAINKLDAADWSEERFNHIVETVGFFLTQAAGFPKGKISYVPTSGITGDNLKTCKDTRLTAWYHGKTLLQRLDEFQPPERPLDKPFTLSVADFWKSGTRISVSGKVDTGTIQLNETVLLQPLNEVATVKTIEVNGSEGHEWAVSGDQVVLGISGPIDIQIMSVSLVLSNPSSPVKVSSHLEARIVVFDIAVPIIPGFRVNFHRQSISEPANISQLISIVDKGTGQSVKRRPRALTKNTAAMVRIVLEKSICVETFKASRDLGRFTLRSGGRTVAAGMVTDVLAYSTVRARDS